MYGYVIFTDIEKYSTLKDADLKIYFNKIIPIIFEELKVYKDSAIIWNTWGDAIFAIYDKAETAINMALAYREAFNKLDFEKFGIKKLNPRIAGNFGEFELLFDPVSGKSNVHGTLVNLTARIEPVTTPGEIFVTKEFRDMSCSSYDKVDNVRFEDMGEIKLPKNAGTLNLYRLCKKAEAPVKPAGIIHSFIDYNIQMPTKANDSKIEKVEKVSIENRLSNNAIIRTSSEEKIKKIANNLKKEAPFENSSKNQTNLIKTLNGFKKRLSSENPFLIAMFIFIAAMCINFILETDFAKNLFDWAGYYFNFALYSLNITLQNSMKISPITNPVTPEFIKMINPWMWLKGFVIGSFVVGQLITFLQKRIIKFKKIIIIPFLIVILHLCLSVLPNHSAPSSSFFMQNIYPSILLLWLFCFLGLMKGVEFSSDKIKASTNNR